eukprot:1143362-Pelagomonas_calceolata.AAC.2
MRRASAEDDAESDDGAVKRSERCHSLGHMYRECGLLRTHCRMWKEDWGISKWHRMGNICRVTLHGAATAQHAWQHFCNHMALLLHSTHGAATTQHAWQQFCSMHGAATAQHAWQNFCSTHAAAAARQALHSTHASAACKALPIQHVQYGQTPSTLNVLFALDYPIFNNYLS